MPRSYTGYDATARSKRPGMETFIDLVDAYFGLWNNGSWVVRNMRGKSKPSVHSTGRAVDFSWRGGSYRGTGNYADCEKLCDFLTANADVLGVELILDYWPRPHGRGWRCDRNAWRTYTRHAMSGSPGGDWVHVEISNEWADDSQYYIDTFQRLLGDPPKEITPAPAKKTVKKPPGKDPWLQVGSKGDKVKEIQVVIGVEADGSFGPVTEAAVKKWQAEHDLFVDGIVGPDTYKAMAGAAPTTAPAPANTPTAADMAVERDATRSVDAPDFALTKRGDKGDLVKAIQAVVGVTADGVFGKFTENAVKQWQASKGLESDGIVGRITYAAMFG